MYLVGIDIAKYKHQCFIATTHGEVIKEFSFDNNSNGFKVLLEHLQALDHSYEIKIGLEATGHYGNTLKHFLSANSYTFVEFNPYLTKQFFKSTTIRKTKTDKIDARMLARMLPSVDYKTLHTKYYHINELKSLCRTRNSLIESRSNTLVQITNALDIIFPEFKRHFNNRLGLTALFILEKYTSPKKIAKLNKNHFEKLYKLSRGKFTYPNFRKLKELAKDTVGIESKSNELKLKLYTKLYHSYNTKIKILEAEIEEIMSYTTSYIKTIPGVSLMSAANILGEVGDFTLFSNPAKLIAFVGYDIAVYQSGESKSYGKLVKRGSSLLRKTVWNIVLGCIREVPVINDYYYKKKNEGKHRNVIFSSIARKLLRIIYYLETNQVSFDQNIIR
ncbi:MAG: IS110 family transposase [Acholeplasmataceae bacterium]|jgi:transposase